MFLKLSKKKPMKTSMALLLATTLCCPAATVHFELSPPGTGAGVGLSPSNEVPPSVTSTGSGNTIGSGLVFDTASLNLNVSIGYGSAEGFTDLTGPAIAMHVHGPAGPGTNAAVLVSLVPLSIPAADPSKGGVILGSVPFPTNEVSDLLAGLTYINVHTTNYPGGEIRGQVIPVFTNYLPPSVMCPTNTTVECGTPAQLTALVSAPEGNALTVVWTVNGTAAQTNAVPASSPPAPAEVLFTSLLPLGTNLVAVTATDNATNSASCAVTVTVVDTTPPVIVAASASPNVLWPPNHKFVNVTVTARVTDTCSATTWKITRVTSNEAVDAKGSGHTSPDWQITGAHTVQLRAERAGPGSGRVYSITIQARDTSGNLSLPKMVTVTVPHDQGKGKGKGK